MGKKIITSLYEFMMTQTAPPKPVEVPGTPTIPGIPPAPLRPGRAIPTTVPNPNEEERPMAKVMRNIEGSLLKEKGSIIAKNLIMQLEELADLGVTEL
jgi:hypothetical protein